MNASARDDVCSAAVAAVKSDLLNCVVSVFCFSDSIHSRYIRYLSVMKRPAKCVSV